MDISGRREFPEQKEAEQAAKPPASRPLKELGELSRKFPVANLRGGAGSGGDAEGEAPAESRPAIRPSQRQINGI